MFTISFRRDGCRCVHPYAPRELDEAVSVAIELSRDFADTYVTVSLSRATVPAIICRCARGRLV